MDHQSALAQLRSSLATLQGKTMPVTDFCRTWRQHQDLLAALPPRYAQVQEDLLGRLEAGSLFSEESCSFSQADLLTQLGMWLDKAEQQLGNI
ncbi:MAG: hypothetical protein V4488_15840 [Pseudomonadota bacterium]